MTARCDLTDLLVDQCAHCRGHEEKPDRTPLVIRHEMDARYGGRCSLNDEHGIREGDRIGLTDDGWVCTRCLEERSP